jgi:citrate synthase
MQGSPVYRGLADVVVTTSQITFIDGKQGRLIYRGYDIRDLATHSSFEEVAYLLWYGHLPRPEEFARLKERLTSLRTLPDGLGAILRAIPRNSSPMEVLRTAVSALSSFEPPEEQKPESSIGGALRLTAVLPTIVATFHRLRNGQDPVPPRKDLGHAANFLYMLSGRLPSEEDARILDVALILHADHELNASTFAARVTASTLSDLYSAVTSAIGTLKGPLHGGANERVMDMLEEIPSPDKVEPYITAKLARHEKIMGFGHRVYKVEDPRATILREYSRRLAEQRQDRRYYDLLRTVEEVVHREKGLYPNVDLYSGSVYTLLGIPKDLFTPVFAISRVAGWTAHVLEEYADNRLIRPMAEYTGPVDLVWTPLDRRTV